MPAHNIFPEFVADQVLTSDDLNNQFGYLDDQGKMTRSNLIGIGIVCGLQVKTTFAVNGTTISSITISKGVGVTSEGYLLRFEQDVIYRGLKPYDAVKDDYYEKFVNEGANPKTKKFDLWELTTAESNLSATPPTLSQCVVLLFVELLKEQNKNCDPNSCDDRGIKVTATIRPLLIAKNPAANLNSLIGSTGNPQRFNPLNALDEIRMPRYLVPDSGVVQSEQLLNGYIDLLSSGLLNTIQDAFTTAYTEYRRLLGDSSPDMNNNPFKDPPAGFDFTNITFKAKLINIQYYYDAVADLLQAYNEFRDLGNKLLSMCCPDTALFPRHLLLGEVVPAAGMFSSYRHYFIYSPLFEQKNLVLELKFLFSRMELMYNQVLIPPPFPAVNGLSQPLIRITPSLLNDSPLSQKAIPFYYNPHAQLPPYMAWNFDKTLRGKAAQNLSYHAPEHYSTDNFVSNPLLYDLEPFNFLRIEGHIGMRYTEVVEKLDDLKKDFRLPIEVVSLSTGDAAFNSMDIGNMREAVKSCNIRDIETSYEIIRREWEAVIGKMIAYLNAHKEDVIPFMKEYPASTDPDYTSSDVFYDYISLLSRAKTYMVADLIDFISSYNDFLVLIYEKIERMSDNLRKFLFKEFINKRSAAVAEDLIDYLDEVALSCKKGGFRSIYQQFTSRIEEIYRNMFLSSFIKKNPGIQHKAGVTMGGTFIIVYHKRQRTSRLPGPFTIRGVVKNASGAPVPSGIVYVNNEATRTNALLDADGRFTLTVESLPAVVSANNMQTFGNAADTPIQAGELLVSSPGQSPVTIRIPSEAAITAGTTSSIYDSLEDGEVIADFFLPYICCSDCAPVQVTINEALPNKPPVAKIKPVGIITLPANDFMLDGTESKDPEGGELQYQWKMDSGPAAVTLTSDKKPTTGVNGLVSGEYIFSLTVTDDYRVTDTAAIHVVVNAGPSVNAGPDDGINMQPVIEGNDPNFKILSGTANDPEGHDFKSILWEEINNTAGLCEIVSGDALETRVNFTKRGTYVFRLTVTDDKGVSASDTVTIIVNGGPVVDAGTVPPVNFQRDRDNIITLAGTIRHPEGYAIQTILWEKADPNQQGADIGSSPDQLSIQIRFTAAGSYGFLLTASDIKGMKASDTTKVVVRIAPVADAGPDQKITLPANKVTLNGTGSGDPDGSIASYSWTGPAGITITNANKEKATVENLQVGIYNFQLTVTDNDGLQATDQVTVMVKSCAPLSDIITEFNRLADVDNSNFSAFTDFYKDYNAITPAIKPLYQDMESPADGPAIALRVVNKQIDFFDTHDSDKSHSKWITDLIAVMQQNAKMELLAVSMLNIHAQLIYYIACIQPEDVDNVNAKVPMTIPLVAIVSTLENIRLRFDPAQHTVLKAPLRRLRTITQAELNRVSFFQEDSAKPVYKVRLNNIITTLNSMNI